MGRPLRRHTDPEYSPASQSLSQHLRGRAFSQSRINPSVHSKCDGQDTKNFSSGFDQNMGDTRAWNTVTASPSQPSPAQSQSKLPASQTDRSFDTSSQRSPSPSCPVCQGATNKVLGKMSYFADFDELGAAYSKKSTGESTKSEIVPPRSSCEQSNIGGTVAPNDDLTQSLDLHAPTQSETSSLTPPSIQRTQVGPHERCASSVPFLPSGDRKFWHEQMAGSGIQAC